MHYKLLQYLFFRQRTWEYQGMMTSLTILNKESARYDDVLHILLVNSEAQQIQKGARILNSCFVRTNSGRPKIR
jgi:hypothetical protein